MNSFIISGPSGSGKSTVLHALEDSGFNCIDNFPASLLVRHVCAQHEIESNEASDLAVCIDARNTLDDLQALPGYIRQLRSDGFNPRVIYLDAEDSVLVKRFSDTRRRHPLDKQFSVLEEAITHERYLLEEISELADLRIDTTTRTIHELDLLTKERVAGHSTSSLSLLFRSFGYKNGVPIDSDFVFDARCLPNPYWHEELRAFNGKHPAIQEFLNSSDVVDAFFNDIKEHLVKWLPVFAEQNRVYVTIAIGCTGGTHRSVYLVERLAEYFKDLYPNVLTRHRQGVA